MVVRKRRAVTHQLVGVSNGQVSTRCGIQFSKPKVGHGAAVAFAWTCDLCDEATEELLATFVAFR
jgi:hypothetical protein